MSAEECPLLRRELADEALLSLDIEFTRAHRRVRHLGLVKSPGEECIDAGGPLQASHHCRCRASDQGAVYAESDQAIERMPGIDLASPREHRRQHTGERWRALREARGRIERRRQALSRGVIAAFRINRSKRLTRFDPLALPQ